MECSGYDTSDQPIIFLCCDTASREWNISIGYDTLTNEFVIYQLCNKFAPGGLGVHPQVPIKHCPFCGSEVSNYVEEKVKPQRRSN